MTAILNFWLQLQRTAGFLLAFAFVFSFVGLGSLWGQVASPHNFPHTYGSANPGDYGPQLLRSYQAMGMNGHVVYTPTDGFNTYHYVLNKSWDKYMNWGTNILGPNVIQKNSHIWLSHSPASRVCTVDTMGVVLNQLTIANSTLVQMVADTNDHVYLVYKANAPVGFGVVRFGASFVPDWHFFYPGADPVEAFWGIDQRLYVTCNGRVTVLDANGNRLKDLMNVGTNYTVYQDHGLGIVSMVADTVKVIRTDSTMAVRWAKKFRPTPGLWGLPYTVIAAAGVAAPGSKDLVVTATARVTLQSTINCNYPFTEEIYLIVLDSNGVVQGQSIYNYGTIPNKYQSTVTGTPFGDPMFAYQVHSCLTAAHIEFRCLGMAPGYDIRQSCSGTPPAVSSQNYTPNPVPSMGTLGTTTAPNLSIAPDNLAFGIFRSSITANVGSVSCVKPCLTFTATPMGGGQVAFNDNTFGYYTIHYDFGDGSTGNTNDPVHNYPAYGTWPVTVIATNACGSDTSVLMVHACATAQVSGPANICVGSANTYTETSGLNGAGLSWLVNGVSMGTGSSFTWTPLVAGTYSLSTVYYDAPCRDTTTRTVLVSPGLPTAGFTYVVSAQRQLTFTNTSIGALSYSWSFGDGSTSTVTNPVKTYSTLWANGGNFTICLIATNACGSDTSCYNFNCPIPFSSFTLPSTAGLTVTITDAAINGNIAWDFGDGTTGTGTTNSHTFALPGTYTICQTVSNACATHSSCKTIMVDNNSSSAFRTTVSTGYDNSVYAIAAQANGDVMVALASSNPNAALVPMDSTGAIRGPMNTWSGSATQIVDLHAMSNGHFAFFGNSFNSGSNFDPMWGEVDKLGNIVQAKYLPISTIGQFGTRAFQLPSGYFYVANESSGPGNYYYIKLDQNFQVQYVRYNTSRIYGGMEAPDGTIWLVQQPNSNSTTLEFVHLNASGVGTEKYTTSVPFGGSSAFFLGEMAFGMDCDGNMYGMLTVSDIYPGLSPTPRLGVFRFNTVTHAVESRLYRVGLGATANNPVHDAVVRTLVKYPNGHWIGWGQLRRTPSQINVPPDWDKFVVDLDPSTFTLGFSGYGTPNTTYAEQTWDAYVAGPGRCYTLGKSGVTAKPVEIHRHSSPSDCQLPASVLAPEAVIEFSNTTATYSGTTVSSTAFNTPAANWARVSAPANGSSLLQCSGACPSGLSASFTYIVVGNTVTLTSTSTPGAMLSWSVQGQGCLANGGSGNVGSTTLTVTLPCGTYPITLTASDQCGTASSTQTITVGSVSTVSIGPNQTVCPGGSATFTATPGFVSYLWSNGSTASSVSVSAVGTYSVTATDAGGCTAIASASLSNYIVPAVSIGGNQTVCVGASATFTATSGFTGYLWSNGSTASSVSVSAVGVYSVTVTDGNGCTGTASATLSNYTAPTVSIGANQTVCPGASATFTATSGFAGYLWSNGSTASSVSVSAVGVYSVTVTDGNGCTATASATLSNYTAPTVSIGANQTVCAGAIATFTATSGFAGYLWSNGSTANSVSVSAVGVYSVTVTDANGCTATASATLSNYPPTNFSLGNDTIFCADTTWALLGPGGATSYTWSTGATTQGIAADTSGTYWLAVADGNGCMATDTIALVLSPDCVWPGDADRDGVANNVDLLAVAYGMAAVGAGRPNATTSWYGQPCADWSGALPLGANFKHLDCDGNGTVQFADTGAIHLNFGLTHNKANGVLTGVPVWIEPELDSFPAGDTVFFLVHWGDGTTPVILGHGLAFALQIDPVNVTPGTLYGRFPNSFLGNGVPDLVTLMVPFAGTGEVYVGVSRHDGVGRSGDGAVMRMGFLPDQVLPLTATLGYVPVRISRIVAVDGDFAAITCAGVDDSILVYNPVNGVGLAGGLLGCDLFPVPAAEVAYLDLRIGEDVEVAITLTDMHGRSLITVQEATGFLAGQHRFTVPTDRVSEGVYFVRVVVGETVKVMKLVVAR